MKMERFDGITVGELIRLATDPEKRSEIEKKLLEIKYFKNNQRSEDITAEELVNEISHKGE